jgi:hypothetical protein
VYPKASVSWLVISSGPTTVRLRGAFGESGVQPTNGAALQLYQPQPLWIDGGLVSAVGLVGPGNPLLQPERSVEYEGGMDLGLWRNRVSFELTGYTKTTQDALVDASAGWDLGGVTYEENIGEVRNSGIEGALTASIVAAREITWDVVLNASVNRNKLVRLAPGVLSEAPGFQFPNSIRHVPGYSLYGYWGVQTAYADANHDGVIETDEVTLADSDSYMGSSVPTREASLATHIGFWKGTLSVGALLDYRGGFRLLNENDFLTTFSGTSQEQNDPATPFWQQARAAAALPAEYIPSVPAGFFEDATYLRFRELSLTWTVPRTWSRAVHFRNLSLTGAVRNLALWTRYTGPDPEVSGDYGNNVNFRSSASVTTIDNNIRLDGGTVPLARYWVLRVNAGF